MNRKSRKVKLIFDEIARTYDFLNHLFSFCMDFHWRKVLVRSMDLDGSTEVLDACTGTGDLAVAIARASKGVKILGVDMSPEMLAIGARKILRKKLEGQINLEEGDVTSLPYVKERFDAVTMAFGLRNIPDRLEVLKEMRRIIKPGSRVFVLEFSPIKNGLGKRIKMFYLRRIMPRLGTFFSGSKEAYSYLNTSIQEFLSPEEVREVFEKADFVDISSRKLFPGIPFLYIARKPG